MKVKLCPICDREMGEGKVCPNCKSYVRKPNYFEKHSYYGTPPAQCRGSVIVSYICPNAEPFTGSNPRAWRAVTFVIS